MSDLMRLHLLRHGALLVASEEALELSYLEPGATGPGVVDFGAIDRALAEAKALDSQIRAALDGTSPQMVPAGPREPSTPEMIEMRRLMDPGNWFL